MVDSIPSLSRRGLLAGAAALPLVGWLGAAPVQAAEPAEGALAQLMLADELGRIAGEERDPVLALAGLRLAAWTHDLAKGADSMLAEQAAAWAKPGSSLGWSVDEAMQWAGAATLLGQSIGTQAPPVTRTPIGSTMASEHRLMRRGDEERILHRTYDRRTWLTLNAQVSNFGSQSCLEIRILGSEHDRKSTNWAASMGPKTLTPGSVVTVIAKNLSDGPISFRISVREGPL